MSQLTVTHPITVSEDYPGGVDRDRERQRFFLEPAHDRNGRHVEHSGDVQRAVRAGGKLDDFDPLGGVIEEASAEVE